MTEYDIILNTLPNPRSIPPSANSKLSQKYSTIVLTSKNNLFIFLIARYLSYLQDMYANMCVLLDPVDPVKASQVKNLIAKRVSKYMLQDTPPDLKS